MKPRVGHIQFLNCFPLFYGLSKKNFLFELDLIQSRPIDLNNMLGSNMLDLSSISSIAYAHSYRDYVLLPDISISADGKVKSVLLFSKVPIGELHRRKIALTNVSAASQALLRIILAKAYNIVPEYLSSAPDLKTMCSKADAALLIGDDALQAYCRKDVNNLYIYDLGEEWKKFTDLPMVFAVWAVRKEFAAQNMQKLKTIKEEFTEAIRYSLENITELSLEASKQRIFAPEFLADYFTTLKFDFDERKQKGLIEYCLQAKDQGLLDEIPSLEILSL